MKGPAFDTRTKKELACYAVDWPTALSHDVGYLHL